MSATLDLTVRCQGHPAITDWCPHCRCRVVTLPSGRCGWCNTRTLQARPPRMTIKAKTVRALRDFGPATTDEIATLLDESTKSIRRALEYLVADDVVEVVAQRPTGAFPANVWALRRST